MEKIDEGKTKEIWQTEPGIVRIISKPIITAEDGKKKNPMKDKDELATTLHQISLNCLIGVE